MGLDVFFRKILLTISIYVVEATTITADVCVVYVEGATINVVKAS